MYNWYNFQAKLQSSSSIVYYRRKQPRKYRIMEGLVPFLILLATFVWLF